MFLNRLILNNYKNIEKTDILFSNGINCITGNNGAGKTNLLSAIYYLSACKDYFNTLDTQNILNEQGFFIIDGYFTLTENTVDRVYCAVQREKGKAVSMNGKEYQRLSDHIGKIPLVMIAPSDILLIYSGSEDRRKMLNLMISQFDKSYLNNVIQYNKALENKNKALKIMQDSHKIDNLTLDMYNNHLIKIGIPIYKARETFMLEFIDVFQKYYSLISQNGENAVLEYQSQLFEGDFSDMLISSRSTELLSGFTTVGIHKDDLIFSIDARTLKKTASQGQQKTFMIAIKLAYYDYAAKKTGIKPILLLDDIFDKLDPERVSKIVELVADDHFGQILITDANKIRMEKILERLKTDYKIFSVSCGRFVELKIKNKK